MYTGTTHDFKPCKLPCWRSARDMQRRALVYPGGIQFHTGFNAATILRLALISESILNKQSQICNKIVF